ncbi:NADH-quinone oxidoreductase subunit C [Acidicapsa ligni]|uniref:NADH-quinone oxidoreductase subunit C n=1 Tax=Acidicapsa ligni TaxID=542300 RepID=UPI0021DF99B8|nr:NADH-quinone oxidoreductase subunit C [Acidicapsa ligni]
MKSAKEILMAIQSALPGAQVEVVLNPSPSGQHSLRIDPASALAVAVFLREDSELALDYCSNATGVDWPDKEVAEKVKVAKVVEGVEQVVEETIKHVEPGYLEAVYHLFSMKKGPVNEPGPVVLRMRTVNRTDQVKLPSLTPVWRSVEFQEREIFDLFGIVFTGHPDLRRILMWDEFEDHPMRRDYVDPDDYEYEPTPHDEVLKRAEEQKAKAAEVTQ